MASPSRLPSLRRPAGSSRPVSMIEGPTSNVPALHSGLRDTEPSEMLKRRSLLPQFPRGVVGEGHEGQGSTEADLDRTSASPRQSDGHKSSGEADRRRALNGGKADMPPPAPKAARPMSMVPPRGSSQSKLPSSRTHARKESKENAVDIAAARAQSLAALSGAAPATRLLADDLGLKRSNSTRLPQTLRAGGPMIPSRTTSAKPKDETASKKPRSRAGPPSDATTRDQFSSTPRASITPTLPRTSTEASAARQNRASVIIPTRQGSRLETSPPSRSSRPRPASQIIAPSMKPAFTTFQQHYSPAKSSLPKPPIPSTKPSHKLSINASEDDEAVSFETMKQQIELLQLSLLHQASHQCLDEYTASARRKLGKVHSRLRREYESLRAMELVQQRAANLSALDAWCPDPALLVENLQILALVYSDISSLMEEGSRHGDVVSMFELWIAEAERSEAGSFVQPLPDDWRSSHGTLLLKLRSIQRNLRVLPTAKSSGIESSGIEVVLRTCKTLVEDMLGELEVMAKLEREMLAREKGKVEREVDAMLMNNDVNVKENWVPVWQKVA
ncbi:hypothetical protein BDY17DRAFT_322802 [Neohortaea acidophila]|uniref:Uncharacterized protein n=1 Tax=Neohortaea acidophila TaxID=245834 RepID=A0A6A6PVZ5_9PEZI|nr:uncharacterized protein BDY17DRAFT_322802 [Neohortaea acidophila]KAF2483911.1 hypothetical protein BDY17DRAFT_322802 [Neohortaea acidophila]